MLIRKDPLQARHVALQGWALVVAAGAHQVHARIDAIASGIDLGAIVMEPGDEAWIIAMLRAHVDHRGELRDADLEFIRRLVMPLLCTPVPPEPTKQVLHWFALDAGANLMMPRSDEAALWGQHANARCAHVQAHGLTDPETSTVDLPAILLAGVFSMPLRDLDRLVIDAAQALPDLGDGYGPWVVHALAKLGHVGLAEKLLALLVSTGAVKSDAPYVLAVAAIAAARRRGAF